MVTAPPARASSSASATREPWATPATANSESTKVSVGMACTTATW